MSLRLPPPSIGRGGGVGLDDGHDMGWRQSANIELFEMRAPCVTPEEDMITQAFQQAYLDACYRALVGQDALRSYGANEEFQIAIDARQPAKYQENQAFIREVVDRFYDDLLSVVIDVTDAEDRARFGAADTIGASRVRRHDAFSDEPGAFSDLPSSPVDLTDASTNEASSSSAPGMGASVDCKSLSSSETWLHYVVPVLGRVVVRNGFFMCFWRSTIGERVGQLECRTSRQVMEVNVSHVHVPLCYHFRYKGRGVTAVSLTPIGDSLTDVSEQNMEVAAIAQQVASAFNLLPYESTGESDAMAVRASLADNNNEAAPSCYRFLPRRVQAHFGRDGRYYLIGNIHWGIPWLNSRHAGDHALQRFSCVSSRLLARKGAHLSCRAFSTEAFIVENKSAIKFMRREIESGIAQLLTDEREAAVRHVLSRQKQRSARRQERRLVAYKARVAQLDADSEAVVVQASAAGDTDMIEMQTMQKNSDPLARTRRTSSVPNRSPPSTNPLATPAESGPAAAAATDGKKAIVDSAAGEFGVDKILSLWRELDATHDDAVSSTWSSDRDSGDSDADSEDTEDIFREQDRTLDNAELLGAHPLEEDNTVNPFSSGSIVERFTRMGYPKSLLGVLLLSLMRFPSPPYHMVREVKREIMVRGLKGYILERAYDARYGVQHSLSHLHSANAANANDADDIASETASVVEGVVVRPREALDRRGSSGTTATSAFPNAVLRAKSRPNKYVWSGDQAANTGDGEEDEGNGEDGYRDPLLLQSARESGDGSGGRKPSRLSAAFSTLRRLGGAFLGHPTTAPVPTVRTVRTGSNAPTPTARSAHASPAPSTAEAGQELQAAKRLSRGAVPPASVLEAYAGAAASGAIDQDFGSIVERVLVGFMQYDATEQPRTGYARVSTLQGGDGDAWVESEILNALYLESVLPFIYRKFRLEPIHVDLTAPLSGEDKLLVYQRVCDGLGVRMRDGRAESCMPSVKDFRPESRVVSRRGPAYAAMDAMSTQLSIPVGDGLMGVQYVVPHWIRTRTDWLVHHLMLNASATRQEWDLYGAALVPFLSIQRQRCLPSTKAAVEDLRTSMWRHGGVGAKLPLPPLAVLGPMLLSQVHHMSTAPQLLWHAWAKDCYAFRERDHTSQQPGTGLPPFTTSHTLRHGGSPGASQGIHHHRPHSGSHAFTLSLTSQGLDQSVEARRGTMRSAGDRACLVHLLRRQAATYAVLTREVTRQMRDVPPENVELISHLAQIQNQASAASVSTMHSAIALADTLLEHLGNPYSFQYRRYSAELVRHMRARRDTLIAAPRFSPTTTTNGSGSDPSGVDSNSSRVHAPPALQRASVFEVRSSSGVAGSADGPPSSPFARSAAGGTRTHSQSGSLLLNDSCDNSLRLASDEEVALLHMLHQIQKYCSQDLLAALDHLQRGVLLFNVAYTQQQEALDDERAAENLFSEDVALNTHMNAEPSMTESLETAYRLLRALDGDAGLYTLRALSNLCVYYYATGNFVNYQESLWSLRRSWNNQGPPDIRGLVVAAPSDFAAARASLSHALRAAETEATTTSNAAEAGVNNTMPDGAAAAPDGQSKSWVHRRKMKAIVFRHLDFCD